MVGVFLALYTAFELYHLSFPGHQDDFDNLIETSLQAGTEHFDQITADLHHTSEEIADWVERALINDQSRMVIYNRVSDKDLWGFTIYKNGEKWLWKDYVINLSAVRDENQVVGRHLEGVRGRPGRDLRTGERDPPLSDPDMADPGRSTGAVNDGSIGDQDVQAHVAALVRDSRVPLVARSATQRAGADQRDQVRRVDCAPPGLC